ncbi:MAG TPA: M13 family metallopeptidase [Fredinandcohnia sp.]|nr:M13 family metallopeptidase [Fredinandcohnia sp.]
MSKRIGIVVAAALCAACTAAEKKANRSEGLPTMGVDLAALDRSADPCVDFYQFACGGWMASTPIPADQARWHRSFSEIQLENERALRRILDDVAAGRMQTPDGEKLAAFWRSCMDEDATREMETLQAELAAIRAIEDRGALGATVARLHAQGVGVFFEFHSAPDFMNAQEVIGMVDQGGLGLPDREFYLRDDDRSQALLRAYGEHVQRMFVLAGDDEEEAARKAEVVLSLEGELAQASMPRVERRDPYKVYNRIDRAGLLERAPTFPWAAYFEASGAGDVQALNVAVPDFFARLDEIVQAREMEELRTYLSWHLLRTAAPSLSEPFVQESFAFQKALTGQEEIAPRWRRCLEFTDEAVGFALARAFVQERFGEEGKEVARRLIHGIEEAFAENLRGLEWMDEETRAQAFEKLRTLQNHVGFPDVWLSYEGLELRDDDLFANRMAAAAFERRRDLAKIGKPVDPNEWFMTPHTVNAYYYSLRNEMVFPAGILQPPFFAAGAPEAANAGAIGMVMGHELTHGFDDRGRQFDAHGNLRSWWSEASSKAFEEKAACVVEQYEQYMVGDLHVNGRLTLGENIADIGGLKLAWMAFQKSRAGREDRVVHGFTEAQQFFLSYAQSWCANVREEFARMRVLTDTHSPPRYRVNGVVSNLPSFQEAFACEPGQPMAPVQRCEVW